MTEINKNYFAPSNHPIFDQKININPISQKLGQRTSISNEIFNPITPQYNSYNNKYLTQTQNRITPTNEVKPFNNFR
jgi:hypothetical protein